MNSMMKTIERKGMVMPIGKIGQRRQVVIPKEIFDALGLQTGDFVEVSQVKRTVVIKPKKIVDADEVLTPEQKAHIDARLAEGLEDIKQGRVLGPFDTAKEAMRALRAKTRR
jgi:AbrB family looped-hinge helix DNA binding protein